MAQIRVLSPHIANQIAAGEVVERPSSVVKELVENALDAGATNITIEIENGGTDLIRVCDNGKGIAEDECKTAFLRHATSKIASVEDLTHIVTLGFRGEALASIAAVAEVSMRTRTVEAEQGTLLRIANGEVLGQSPCACMVGTSLEVRNLFSNVPARLKFLKSVRTEAGYISDYVSRMMMAVPSVAFHLINNGKTVYQTFGDGKLKNALLCVYGAEVLPHLRDVAFDDGYLSIDGFVGTENISRPNRLQQSFFLNGRYIRSYSLSAALQRAFDTRLMVGRFPFAVLAMRIAGGEVDVNVHPTKMEVRFVDEQRIIRSVTAACHRALLSCTSMESAAASERDSIMAETPPADPVRSPASHVAVDLPNLRGSIQPSAQPIREAQPAYRRSASPTFSWPPAPRPSAPAAQAVVHRIDTNTRDEQPKAEHPEQLLLTTLPYTILGAAFQTYWIVQQGENLFLIDQHAAHERRIYEALMQRTLEAVSQPLLTPQPVSLSPLELDAFEENREALEELGFSFDFRDDGTVLLCSVPQILGEPLTGAYLHDALEQLTIVGKTSARELRRERIIQSACKHAVKAGEPLDRQEIARLLSDFEREGIPLTCPHGRPAMIRLSKREIEKLFKRVL